MFSLVSRKFLAMRNITLYSPNVSTTPITAMGCRQCLSLSVVQLKGKHCRKPHCRNGVVDTFRQRLFSWPISLKLYNVILRIARNFLETRENINISTHPFYHINLDWFSWEWSEKKSKWPTQKNWVFQNRQFSKLFCETFMDWSFG